MPVTIVIPCYNYAKYLPEAIESALGQGEIIVVNDGSTDNTSEIARKYGVKLIEQGNKGLAAARNSGFREAKTEWVLPLDADDKLAPNCVKRLLENSEFDEIISPGQTEFGERSQYIKPQIHLSFGDFVQFNRIHCSSLILREVWEKVGGYDEKMRDGYEDWLFNLQALKAGYTITTVDEPLFFYRIHSDSMVNKTKLKHKEIYDYMLNKFAK